MTSSYLAPRAENDLAARWTDFLAEHPGALLRPPQEANGLWELSMSPAVILGTDAATLLWAANRHMQENDYVQAAHGCI